MKRNAIKLLTLTMGTILAAALTACGDGSTEEVLTPQTLEAQPMLSDLEQEILDMETQYNKGEFAQADYLALADAYSRAGYIRKQRDMLEQDYRLYGDAEAFAALQGISVNLEEESAEISQRAKEMLNNLELTEYLDESINLIDSADWFSTMMPKLKEGKRNYYLEQEGGTLLYVQVGYTEAGERFSKVWYTGNGSKRFLSQEGAAIRMVTVEAEGAFDSWSMDCASGNITHEQGTLTDGMITGEYTCGIHTGEGGLEAYSLWSSREGVDYVTYTGSFDAEGKILTEQPAADVKKKLLEGTEYTDLVLYAYDASGQKCLWQGIGADTTAEDFRFGTELIGLDTQPEYTAYEVKTMTAEDTATAEGTDVTAQVRIYDGEVQWFDGKSWISAGSVEELEKQDPFVAYEENRAGAAAENNTGSITGNAATSGDGQNADKNTGSIQQATPTPTAKPATTKPAANKPAATPAPTAAPTPAPAQSNNDSGSSGGGSSDSGSSDSGSSDSGSSDSGSSDSGSSDSGSSDSGSSDSGSDSGSTGGDSGGNDVDVDWTPDLL